jgi:hypothetical protein
MGGIRRRDGSWAVRVAGVASVLAQQAVSATYTPPRLVLAYPAPGVSIPGDNATVLFEYASIDVDPLDLRSFRVTVDGSDRTSHFRVTASAAWGTVAGADATGIRAHDVRARICSIRGVCATADAIVTVAGSPMPAKPSTSMERRGKIIDVVLEMMRRLLRS